MKQTIKPQLKSGYLTFIIRAILLLVVTLSGLNQAYASNKDALAPKSAKSDALALPLHTATIATVSLEQSLLFYRDGMGMQVKGPIKLSDKQIKQQRKLWNIPQDISWQTYHLYRISSI